MVTPHVKIRIYVWKRENGSTEFCLPVHLLTGFQKSGRENQGELVFGIRGLYFLAGQVFGDSF